MRMAFALAALLILSIAAAPKATTQPATIPSGPVPPLAWKAKADAPGWVQARLEQLQKSREHNAERGPKDIAGIDRNIEEYRNARINPKLKVAKSSVGGTSFRSEIDRQAAIENLQTVRAEAVKDLKAAYDANHINLDYKPKDEKTTIRDWVEPSTSAPAVDTTPKQ